MNHLQEWLHSCVDEDLVRLNVIPLKGQSPYQYLLYSEDISRRNDGRVSDRILKRYQHVEQGGWWCSGIDVLTGNDELWGCFKPTQPRLSPNRHKPIKYEHPPQAPSSLFALRLTQPIWQQIAARYQLDISPEDIQAEQPDLGFWEWFVNHSTIPLCITEGAKKAGALLTAGYAAIALPGVFGGYRLPRDVEGNRIGTPRLIPQLLKLATSGRPIYLAFDQDTKPSTLKHVNVAIRKLGMLLAQQGCPVKVMMWNPQLGKGVDDLIAGGGADACEQVYQTAVPLDIWKAQSLNSLTYPAAFEVHGRYLPEVPIPATAKLIGIKSPKGTGKTCLLEDIVQQALKRQQRVLVIGHRVRLVEALCQRFGLDYITQVPDAASDAVLGYGLCLDSLHPASQARFEALDWSDGVVIIDEVEQVLWHGLDSCTCSQNRVAILKSLKTLMQNVLGGEGQVFVADADLSDVSLDYLMALAGVHLQPFIIANSWKPGINESWQVHTYSESTPHQLLRDLEAHIRSGGKPFVCLSAQKPKSQWGTRTLEAYLKEQFPHAKILRIDSESLAEPTHPAYRCTTNLEQVLKQHDIVLASPAIETGVSIDIRGHFTSVWAIAQGVQTANSVRQALGRIRENIPRFIWVAPYGFNRVGNGSTSIPALLNSEQNLTQLNIRLLQQSDFEALDDIETGFQAESLLCWAKMAVRLNASMSQYRESVVVGLRNEGHQVIDVPTVDRGLVLLGNRKSKRSHPFSTKQQVQTQPDDLKAAIKAVRDQNYLDECEAIASAEDLSESQYQTLQKRLVKTPTQRRSLLKYQLKQRYGLPVTAQLVAKDDQGWYGKLLLHYFLTLGRHQLAGRDAANARQLLEQGQGSIFLPDFNDSQLGTAIGMMERLGVPILIQDLGREWQNTDEDLQAMAAVALTHRTSVKTTLGIGLSQKATPITITRRLLDKIGYGLQCVRRVRQVATAGASPTWVRVYQVVQPHDGRDKVFKQWLGYISPSLSAGIHQVGSNLGEVDTSQHLVCVDKLEYVQLSLNF
ncbi:MAG TPA: bifunctional DNA primase/helicase [Cyanobacteria bacterium UBA8803]|nr:bifunctional DNA primase/helicase [Cyanobacteria bacterium UBA9273]HBL57858.1 bifunctional DNA primase/helicase [Cyanobacteria bacterium UBA8803]